MRDSRGSFYRKLKLDSATWKAVNFFRKIRFEMLKNSEVKRADKREKKQKT